ncbi:FHA domain-containing protein [Frankia sp. AvcI1]|uniref:FHA domain-containing protein n=1 Tax=Frankia sp. AvcI1 TaxID=573496 RepID=UPI0007C68DFD|nr:FHA domain-containing protein [Frankia sp. AvcI1]
MRRETCPLCGCPRRGVQTHCRACDHNFATGTGPLPANAVPLRVAPSPTGSSPTGSTRAETPGGVAGRWSARISVDRAFFARGDGTDAPAFPERSRPMTVELTAARTVVGRRSRSQRTPPGIDLSGDPGDPGVSRSHAVLELLADGSLRVSDLGSSNGTWVGPDPAHLVRLTPGSAVALDDGDRVYLGSWTRITVHHR